MEITLSLPAHREPWYKASSLYVDVVLMILLVYVGSDTVAHKVTTFLRLNAAATIVLTVCFCVATV